MPLKGKKFRDRDDYATNASKRHKQVGQILSEGMFENMAVYQEYPVQLINPDCPNSRLKVDWYIKTMNIAIEVQGEHHYKPVQYGGQTEFAAKDNYVKQVHKDVNKARYCEAVGCPVIEVHYNDTLSLDWLLTRIKDASERVEAPEKVVKKREKSDWEKKMAERRRAYNREQYRRARDRRRKQ